jgi:hypothetical protein
MKTLATVTTIVNDHASGVPCPICKASNERPGGSDEPKRPVFISACEGCGHVWKRMNSDGAARGRCTAVTMFNSLRGWTERDTKTRNKQIEKDRFKVESINGLQFAVSRDGGWDDRIFFSVEGDDLSTIVVKKGAKDTSPARYTVVRADDGDCKFRNGKNEDLEGWQVMKSALEALLSAEAVSQ